MTLGTALVNCKLGPAPIDTFRKDGRTQLRPGCGRRFVSRPIAVGDFAEPIGLFNIRGCSLGLADKAGCGQG